MKQLTKDDLLTQVKNEVVIQDYSKKPEIEGIKITEIKRYGGEDGTFEDLVRINESGYLELFPEFQLRQINRSKLIGNAIKAWHIHLNQEDIWYIPPEDHMMLGLWDVRENSSTKDLKMRVLMGTGAPKLVYIPRGVAHGVVNWSKKAGTIIYLVNNQFNLQNPDEYRLPWDKAGREFWEIEKG
ncbi:MAG: hypothetical protein US11_C0003G0031 [Candidatus Roizmanbacteria bacterium GW2011_GWA2_36_23]|uniref:dTDP-4-dehydrorhamnose 3,5-epimerase n=1 Tax=Candidatus Roizmanbacteria bacterium GW2011_GWA2_36_23 TaxID=1618480 RepID=A0A0G0E4Q6_9BACT|nr:MAG: hypothetical protein US11_C0003G0031 [Candidatus Roizmanbacteria bacterium GW2011_GWA2_36_23]